MGRLLYLLHKSIGRTALFSLLLLVVLVCSQSILADAAPDQSGTIDFPAIDAYLTAQMKKHDLAGVALAVIQGEEVVYIKGYGVTGDGTPMTPQTQMYIGSQTKSFTALAISQLAEAGLLDINAPIQTYIPWFEVADPQASRQITLNHFLHHSSGLSEAGFGMYLKADASLEECVRALKYAHLTAPVGSQFQYFNYGYDVLGYVIERVSGETYAGYIRANILQPLNMVNTTADPLDAPGLSTGHTRLFGMSVPLKEPPFQPDTPAGFIVSTVEDMAHYAIAMNHRGEYQGQKLLSDRGMREMFRPGLGSYGMGWFTGASYGTTHIYHGGANRTFHTYVDLYPQRDRGFVLIVNQGSQPDHFISANALFLGMDAIVLGQTPPPIDQGMPVRWIGWGLLVLVIVLVGLHTWNFYRLRDWSRRARRMSRARLIWDVAVSFLLPVVIMTVVITQLKGFYGYRFNLVVQMQQIFRMVPEIALLLLVGIVPDLVQGCIKLYWGIGGGISSNRSRFTHMAESMDR